MKKIKVVELPKQKLIQNLRNKAIELLNEGSFKDAATLCGFLSCDVDFHSTNIV